MEVLKNTGIVLVPGKYLKILIIYLNSGFK